MPEEICDMSGSQDQKPLPKPEGKNGNNKGKEKKDNENTNPKDRKHDRKNPRGDKKPSKKPVNDPKWYYSSSNIASSVASIPFNRLPGLREKIYSALDAKNIDVSTQSTPAVMTMDYICSPGLSLDETSAINIASTGLYSFVRHANSGHANYEHPDLTIYILAMAEIYSQYFEAVRIYQTLNTFILTNRNVPYALLAAMRISPDKVAKITSDIANLRARLNVFAQSASSLYVPEVFSSFKRQALIGQAIFLDSDSDKAQMFIFRKAGYRVFDPTYATGGKLVFKQATSFTSINDIMAPLEEMLGAIRTDEDNNIISGDMMKAYGKDASVKRFVLPFVEENAKANFIYDQTVLSQFENAYVFDYSNRAGAIDSGCKSQDIYQKGGNIICEQSVTTGTKISLHDIYFNMHKDKVTYEDNLEATRCITALRSEYPGSASTYYVQTGSELYCAFHIFTYNFNKQSPDPGSLGYRDFAFSSNPQMVSISYSSTTAGATYNINTGLLNIIAIQKFDWHPTIYPYTTIVKDGVRTDYGFGPMSDLDNYTILDLDTVGAIHDAVLLHQYGHTVTKTE